VLSKLRKELESKGAGFVEGKDLESLDMRFALLGKSGYSERPQTRTADFWLRLRGHIEIQLLAVR
jgi:hypothetical protein